MKYAEQQKRKCNEDIARIKESLPDYAGMYIDAVASRKDTSYRTGRAYAYDLLIFFKYLRDVKGESSPTPAYLDSLLPMDIDAYVSALAYYTPKEDLDYNKEIREENERAKAEGQQKALLKKEKSRQMSAAARARNLSAVRGLYKYLLKNRMVQNNPAALAETPRPQKKPVIYMNEEQVGTVMGRLAATDISRTRKQFAKRQQLRDIAMITLMLFTGIRVSECVGIDLSDINWKDRGVKVRRKGGDDQVVYFNEEVETALRDYINNERITPEDDPDALFVSRRKDRISVRSAENVVRKYTENVSENVISAHKLRSTYASALYRATSDAYLVKDALGHKTLGVVQKYIAEDDARRKRASIEIKY